jgi:eukaryotic-like serine/threonine-protein kinase
VSPEILTLADRYVLEAPIASGGMATVYRARDEVLARTVAVKILHPHLASDNDFLERFRREALSAARLSHPHIVAIYDSGAQPSASGDPDHHFIVMEHCGGGTLAGVVERSGPMAPERAVAIVTTICEALTYAHRAGIVHRDIKPANVLISEDGSLKVGDFGIAKAAFAAGDLTTTGSILGTVTYLAPEQLAGLEPDARSDVYSVGVLLYELLAGRPPFQGATQLATAMMHQREPAAALRSIRVGIPRPLDSAVAKALAKDPAERFTSAHELSAALSPRARPATAVLEVESDRREPRRESNEEEASSPRLIPVIVAVAVAVGVALALPGLLDRSSQTGAGAGPGASRSPRRQGSPTTVEVTTVSDFDPYGGDGEHPEDTGLAVDGKTSTAWTTSDYSDSLQAVKPGVGLLLDLGRSRDIQGVTVVTNTPGYSFELRAGERRSTDAGAYDVVKRLRAAGIREEVVFPTVSARFWLLWITSLPGGGGGNASIAEVKFLGR